MVVVIAVFLAVVVVTMCVAPLAVERSPFRSSAHQAPLLLGLVVVVVVYSLIANTSVLDRLFYTYDLQRVSGVPLSQLFDPAAFKATAGTEPAYLLLLWVMSRFGTTTAVFFVFIAVTSSVLYLWPLVRLLGWWTATYVFMLALALGTFTNYTSIVARQSVAMALLSAALCWAVIGRRHTLALALAVAACLIHWSAIPFALVLLVVARFRVPLRLALVAWVVAAAAFLTHSQALLLGGLTAYVPKFSSYTSTSLASVYGGGVNRVDFFALGAAMLIGFLVLRRFLDLPDWYTRALVVFIGYNTIFLLGGFVFYSDRLAAYSWYLAPLLGAAPVLARATSTARVLAVCVALAGLAAATFAGPFAMGSPLWALT